MVLRVLPAKLVLPVALQDHRYTLTMGRRQVVRHQVLVLAFGSSSLSGPAMKTLHPVWSFFMACVSDPNYRVCIRG